MKNKNLGLAILLLSLSLTSCGGEKIVPSSSLPVGLDNVTNIKFDNYVISFDEVKDAKVYLIKIYDKDNNLVLDKITDVPFYDIEGMDIHGKNTVKITAKGYDKQSETAVHEFVAYDVEKNVILEAEHGLLNYGSTNAANYRNNVMAHNGAYVGGIDDCGQGIHHDYYCYVPGIHSLNIWYLTDLPGSFHEVIVNNKLQGRAIYTEKTGWGAERSFNPAMVTINIDLALGWNSIDIIKKATRDEGPGANTWGGFAELDYIEIVGTGKEYNPDEFNKELPTYKLEAELAKPIKWDANTESWIVKNPAIRADNCSNGYIMGGMDMEGEGIEYHFNAPKKGKYELSMCYAHDNEGEGTFATITTSESREKKVINLTTRTGWERPILAEEKAIIDLDVDGNSIFIKKLDGTKPYQVDYILLRFIGG